MRALTAERLRELLDYDPATGVFTWRVSRKKCAVGSVAGGRYALPGASGFFYNKIGIDYRGYRASHLAWLYVYGEWPKDEIDHKDLNESNDAIWNLREATRLQNSCNTRIRKHNLARLKGVRKMPDRLKLKKPWVARITINRAEKSLGYFASALEAAAAYDDAARLHHGEFARTNKMLGLLP